MAIFGHWVHDLDPFALRIHGEFGIRWYGVSYLVGILLGYWIIRRRQKKELIPLCEGEPLDFIMIAALSMVVGGRLGYCLFYAFDQFLANPLFVFNMLQGGMSSHGGIIGLVLGTWIWARTHRRNTLILCDELAAVAPLGVIAGRLANFVNGELWGRPSDVPWAVIFPRSETMIPRHPSQLYAAFFEGVLVLLIAWPIHRRSRRPGLTLGAVLSVYSVGRFVDEFWREPDPGYNLFFGWMSKGQLYTIPVLLIGVVLIVWAMRRSPRPEQYLPPPPEQPKEKEKKEKPRKGRDKR